MTDWCRKGYAATHNKNMSVSALVNVSLDSIWYRYDKMVKVNCILWSAFSKEVYSFVRCGNVVKTPLFSLGS